MRGELVIKKLKKEFAGRLAEAMAFAGLDGSPTSLSRHFNLHAGMDSVTMHGARRWLMGESIPSRSRLPVLARTLGVSADWLLLGQGAMREGAAADVPADEAELLSRFRLLPAHQRALVHQLVEALSTERRSKG